MVLSPDAYCMLCPGYCRKDGHGHMHEASPSTAGWAAGRVTVGAAILAAAVSRAAAVFEATPGKDIGSKGGQLYQASRYFIRGNYNDV